MEIIGFYDAAGKYGVAFLVEGSAPVDIFITRGDMIAGHTVCILYLKVVQRYSKYCGLKICFQLKYFCETYLCM